MRGWMEGKKLSEADQREGERERESERRIGGGSYAREGQTELVTSLRMVSGREVNGKKR